MQNVYGIIILMENTYGNNNRGIRDHFSQLKNEFGSIWPLGYDSFSALLRYYLFLKFITNFLF